MSARAADAEAGGLEGEPRPDAVAEREPPGSSADAIRIFEELRGLGYQGGYDAVRLYAKGWQREQASLSADAFVPLSFDPSEAYQFDWSHEIVLINGTTVTVEACLGQRRGKAFRALPLLQPVPSRS